MRATIRLKRVPSAAAVPYIVGSARAPANRVVPSPPHHGTRCNRHHCRRHRADDDNQSLIFCFSFSQTGCLYECKNILFFLSQKQIRFSHNRQYCLWRDKFCRYDITFVCFYFIKNKNVEKNAHHDAVSISFRDATKRRLFFARDKRAYLIVIIVQFL